MIPEPLVRSNRGSYPPLLWQRVSGVEASWSVYKSPDYWESTWAQSRAIKEESDEGDGDDGWREKDVQAWKIVRRAGGGDMKSLLTVLSSFLGCKVLIRPLHSLCVCVCVSSLIYVCPCYHFNIGCSTNSDLVCFVSLNTRMLIWSSL